MLQLRRTKLMHNIAFKANIHNMLQQPCIASPGIHNIYKQKGAQHVQAHTHTTKSHTSPKANGSRRPYHNDMQKGAS
jgi:hypothetical protein